MWEKGVGEGENRGGEFKDVFIQWGEEKVTWVCTGTV